MRALIVLDRDPTDLEPIIGALIERGHEVTRASYHDTVDQLSRGMLVDTDLLIADAQIAPPSDLAALVAASAPGTEMITIGAREHLPPEVVANLEPPVDAERLLGLVDEIADIISGERSRAPLDLVNFDTVFAGTSAAARTLMRRVRLVARSDEPVWIFGNDGSGRAVVARAIHDRSPRRRDPFVALNAAAFSDDELCRRMFSGPDAAVARAAKGTLFLDQLTSVGPQTQRQLLQFLVEKTHDDPSARVLVGVSSSQGQPTLASDLYYRLKVLEVEVPALKERTQDLEAIVGTMLGRLAPSLEQPPAVSAEAMRVLENYDFPGNLQELAHALTHAVVLAHGRAIEPHHLPSAMKAQLPRDPQAQPSTTAEATTELQPLDNVSKQFEREYLIRVLRSVDGSRVRAAEILGLSRKGLWGKLKAHGITDDDIETDSNADDADGIVVEGPWKPSRS